MATLYSDKVAALAPARQLPYACIPATAEFSLAAALALNDVIQMVTVPKGATILDMILSCSDLDTGGTAIVLDVGDGGDTDRFIDGATIGGAGGLVRPTLHAGHGYTYTEEDTIDILVQVGPTTGATTGTIRLTVFYTMDK